MNQNPPKLRRHATGQFMVTYAGKDHYLGHDAERANAAYLKHLQDWAAWRADRNTKKFPSMQRRRMRIAEAAELFLSEKAADGNEARRDYYAKHLARFLHAFGVAYLDAVTPPMLQRLKDEMLKHEYAPRTVNHDLTAIRGLIGWASDMGYMQPVSLRGVRKLALGEPPDKSLPWREVRRMMLEAEPTMTPWLALNWLALMRPSEVIRLVRKQGKMVEYGVFLLDRGKMDGRSSFRRHVVLSDEALRWLRVAEPRWSRLDSYSQAVRDCVGHGPGALRHTAATYLARAGADRATIGLLLGHSPGRVAMTYARISWPALRQTAGLLTLAPVVQPAARSS